MQLSPQKEYQSFLRNHEESWRKGNMPGEKRWANVSVFKKIKERAYKLKTRESGVNSINITEKMCQNRLPLLFIHEQSTFHNGLANYGPRVKSRQHPIFT